MNVTDTELPGATSATSGQVSVWRPSGPVLTCGSPTSAGVTDPGTKVAPAGSSSLNETLNSGTAPVWAGLVAVRV